MALQEHRWMLGGAPIAFAAFTLTAGTVHAQAEPESADEIVVTASGRDTSVQDIPYNISVKSGEALEEAGITDFAGLARQVPGMAYTDQGARSSGIGNGIILRGLNGSEVTGALTPSLSGQLVSVYINSVPLFSNLKIHDIERVEVLRGPQGTLYGAGSIGGTVRFLFNKPDPSALSLDVQGTLSNVSHAGEPEYSFDAIVNIPVTDRFALRFSGGYEDAPGVVDAVNLMQFGANGNPLLADPSDYFGSPGVFGKRKHVDDSDMLYLRGSALFEGAEGFEALLTVQHQRTDASDFSGQFPDGPKREHRRFRTSPSRTDVTLAALELTKDFGFATLTSSTSYATTKVRSNYDATNYGLELAGFYAGFPRLASNSDMNFRDKNFIQEMRIISEEGGDWDWVVGAYHSNFKRHQVINTFTPGWAEYTNTPGHPDAVAALGRPDATYAQYQQTFYPDAMFNSDLTYVYDRWVKTTNTAVYAELTYNLTPAWSATAGGRVFWVKNKRRSVQEFPASGAGGAFDASQSTSDSDKIFKLNTSYDISDNLMVYLTWSQGFREGGGNGLPVTGPFAQDPALLSYEADFANNYEAGIRGKLGRIARFSAAIYKVKWSDMQVQIFVPFGFPAIVNGAKAVSQGLEFESQITPVDGLDVTLGYTYTDAKLTEDFSRLGFTGFKGDRLPGVPKHIATAGFTYKQPDDVLGGKLIYHADWSYRSSATSSINVGAGNFAKLSGFSTFNASIAWQGGNLRARVFVDNITDEVGVTGVSLDGGPGDMEFIQRPRTVGVTLGYAF